MNLGPKSRVVLPLYSMKNGFKIVPEKSGLNQWNAGGRSRNPGEAYFPIPSVVHKKCPGFFPNRNSAFNLELPTGRTVRAKVCQSGSKALMSSPNSDLSFWLFLKIDQSLEHYVERFAKKVPYAYSDLERIGFDAVVVTPMSGGGYFLDQASLGEYEKWLQFE